MWPLSPQCPFQRRPLWCGWKECALASVGAAESATDLEEEGPAWLISSCFTAPRQCERWEEKCVHTGAQNQAQGAQPCKLRAIGIEAWEEGLFQFLCEKGEGDCAGEGPWQLSGPHCFIHSGGYPGELQSSGSLASATCVCAWKCSLLSILT